MYDSKLPFKMKFEMVPDPSLDEVLFLCSYTAPDNLYLQIAFVKILSNLSSACVEKKESFAS
jgi:hypothetical protein